MKLASIIVFVTLLAGCAATGGEPVADGVVTVVAAPEDRVLDVTVIVGEDASEQAQAHLRSSRYVLFPDGSLHYADAAEDEFARGSEWLPPQTRILTSGQLERVWILADELGFTDPEGGIGPRNLALIEPDPRGITFIMSVAGGATSRLFVHRSEADEPNAAAARLTRQLAILAWADDRYVAPLIVSPKRYDLGPDPYARYRR